MVRNYVRKTIKGADGNRYSKEDLQHAVADVRNGNRTLCGASRFYDIPKTTLKHHVQGTRGSIGKVAENGEGGGGKTEIPLKNENELANCLKVLEKWGFGISKEEVLDIVQAYVKSNELDTRFKDGRPGFDWFFNFKQRHNLSLKKPQGVEYVRAIQTNPTVMYGFFDILEKVVKDMNLESKPHLIFNCDEMSFSKDPAKTKVVGNVGDRCTRMISSSGRENTSVLLCCSASGDKLPILCIFKGEHILETWIKSDTPYDKTQYLSLTHICCPSL